MNVFVKPHVREYVKRVMNNPSPPPPHISGLQTINVDMEMSEDKPLGEGSRLDTTLPVVPVYPPGPTHESSGLGNRDTVLPPPPSYQADLTTYT